MLLTASLKCVKSTEARYYQRIYHVSSVSVASTGFLIHPEAICLFVINWLDNQLITGFSCISYLYFLIGLTVNAHTQQVSTHSGRVIQYFRFPFRTASKLINISCSTYVRIINRIICKFASVYWICLLLIN